jgi:hypothetical protein
LSAYHGCQKSVVKSSPSTAITCLIGKPYFLREREVALVVRRHAHHRAVAVAIST